MYMIDFISSESSSVDEVVEKIIDKTIWALIFEGAKALFSGFVSNSYCLSIIC